jgi:hypothetical protein
MLLANPKTLAAMKAKETEAGKGGGKAGAKKDLKSDSKDALSSLPNIADLLQLSADSAVAAPGMGIDFATSPVQQQQSRGTELLIAQQQKETAPLPPSKSKGKLSPTRLAAAAESPVKRSDPSPQKASTNVAVRDNSRSPAKGKGKTAGKSPGKGMGADSKDKLSQSAEYEWGKREARLQAEVDREKAAAASATALVSEMQHELSAAKQRLVLVENGSELSGLQFAVSNLEQLLRQSEQDRVGLLQVTARGGGQLGDASTHTTLFQHLPLPDAERHPRASRRF